MSRAHANVAHQALDHARARIDALGEDAVWKHWPDDALLWRLVELAGGRPRPLAAGLQVLVPPGPNEGKPEARLASAYVCGALLIALSPTHYGPNGLSLGAGRPHDPAPGGKPLTAADHLAAALAAVAKARQRSLVSPQLQLELRRLHHGLGQMRAAVLQREQTALQRKRRPSA
ncbi:MAG: hypothetical protein GEU81_03005 [Nitriliruptorales bacterium]|nr:hypothetical protein [Nitriliruptorales bacterium]